MGDVGDGTDKDALRAMIYLIDDDFKVKFVSDSVADKFHCKSCDLVGKSVWSLLGNMQSATGKENIMKTFSSGRPFQSTTEVTFPSGPRVLATVLFPIMGKRGAVSEILGVSYDLTEHHEKEQLVRNKMEIIMGYAEILQNLVDDGDARKMVDKIRDAGAALQVKLDSAKS